MELIPIFSTPIWMSVYPDFEEHKNSFLTCVRNFKEKNPQKENKTTVAGYQSPSSLQGEAEMRPLFEYVCEMAIKAAQDLAFVENNIFLTDAWVNFNDSRECMNIQHTHEGILSGIFYLKVPPKSGKLVLSNPGINPLWGGIQLAKEKNPLTAALTRIEPEEGSILLFPSYLPHSVNTNNHDDERISISFNIIVLPNQKETT
jgi:uncharacterized protein (TIGR02466 family)